MKSAIFAAAAVAAVASAHEARAPLDLGLDLLGLVKVDVCLDLKLDVKVPVGIKLDTGDCPKKAPPPDCTNVWHPPHHVDMDGCDNNDHHGWHWVHPCNCEPTAPPHTWATSTMTETCISTVIGCPPEVTDCPGRTTSTITIPATTTICPVPVTTTTLATVTATASWTAPATTEHHQTTWTVPATQQPPASTYCPETETPVVVAPPATTPVVVAPPQGTGYTPPANNGNWTNPPVMAGATQNGQKVGAVVAMGLAALLI